MRIKFSKKIVVFCIIAIAVFSGYILLLFERTGSTPDTLITCFFAFFGTELGAMAAIKCMEKPESDETKKDAEIERGESVWR